MKVFDVFSAQTGLIKELLFFGNNGLNKQGLGVFP